MNNCAFWIILHDLLFSMTASFCLFVCLFVCIYVCLFISLFVCLFVCLFLCFFVSLFVFQNPINAFRIVYRRRCMLGKQIIELNYIDKAEVFEKKRLKTNDV